MAAHGFHTAYKCHLKFPWRMTIMIWFDDTENASKFIHHNGLHSTFVSSPDYSLITARRRRFLWRMSPTVTQGRAYRLRVIHHGRQIQKALGLLQSLSSNEKLSNWAIRDLMDAYDFRYQIGPKSHDNDDLLLRYGSHIEVSLHADVFSRSHASVASLNLDRVESL